MTGYNRIWEVLIMNSEFRELRLNQIDRSLEPFSGTQAVSRPRRGWLRSLREALGISMREVARKMRKTPQTVASFEKSEAADRITLQTLRHYAEAMDCELVYAIVPKTGSLKQLGEKRARDQTPVEEALRRYLDAERSHPGCQYASQSRGAGRPHSQSGHSRRVERMGAR